MGPKSNEWFQSKKRRDPETRMRPCEDRDRDGRVGTQNRDSWGHRMLGETRGDPPLEPSERVCP